MTPQEQPDSLDCGFHTDGLGKCTCAKPDSQAVHKTFALKKSGRAHPTNNHEEFMMIDTRDSQAGDVSDCPICEQKIGLNRWIYLHDDITYHKKCYRNAERLATERAIATEHYWIRHYGQQRKYLDGSDGDMPQINELKRHQQLHKDRLAELTATLTKEAE